MGRLKKYLTDEQVKAAKSEATKRWYKKNKKSCDAKALARYHSKKTNNGQGI